MVPLIFVPLLSISPLQNTGQPLVPPCTPPQQALQPVVLVLLLVTFSSFPFCSALRFQQALEGEVLVRLLFSFYSPFCSSSSSTPGISKFLSQNGAFAASLHLLLHLLPLFLLLLPTRSQQALEPVVKWDGAPLGEGGANKLWQSSGYHTQHTLAQEPTPPPTNIVMQILSLENRALSFKYCPQTKTEDHNDIAKHTYNANIAPIKSQNRDVCNLAANGLRMAATAFNHKKYTLKISLHYCLVQKLLK